MLLGHSGESILNGTLAATVGNTVQDSGVCYVLPKGSDDTNRSLTPPGAG